MYYRIQPQCMQSITYIIVYVNENHHSWLREYNSLKTNGPD